MLGRPIVLALVAGWLTASGLLAASRPNVVLFFVDTLRAQNVHCLGYPRRTTDSIDRAAERGVIFERAIAPSGWSLPSYCSIFTSQPPPAFGTLEQNIALAPGFVTLAEIFSAFGYQTGAYVGGGHLRGSFGLAQGFETYDDEPNFGSLLHSVPKAVRWLEKRDRAKPFLLFIQGYDCHAPYSAPIGLGELYDPGYRGPVHDLKLLDDRHHLTISNGVFESSDGEPVKLAARDIAHVAAHYDAAVTYADTWLGVFVEQLERLGHGKDTILVVAGDHGEELGERGRFGHRDNSLYDTVIRVPLVVTGPGVAQGRRVTDMVELADLAPTLVELCGIPRNAQHRGRSLAAYLDAARQPPSDPERAAFSHRAATTSVRTRRWHLLRSQDGTSLYDLQADPGERADVADSEPGVKRRLESLALDWLEQAVQIHPAKPAALTDVEKALLKGRGYW